MSAKEKVSKKLQEMKEVISKVERQFGKGALMLMGEHHIAESIDVISTGSQGLDTALGIGGLPKGRVVEIYGPESSGKTTLALHAIANAQKQGENCAFIDAEHALDIHYAAQLGVDIEKLLVSQPDHGEQALEIVETLIRSSVVSVVVIDSVAALTPRAEIEGDMGDSHMGLQARLMSQALRKLTAISHRQGSMLLFINQVRQKIGISFGNPEVTTGGNALKFYATQRLDIRRIGAVKDGDKIIGNKTKVKVVKNKLAPPFQVAEFEILYGSGINLCGEVIDKAIEQGIIEKSGSWYSYSGKRLGQGREKTREYLKTHESVLLEITKNLQQPKKVITQLQPSQDAA